MGNTNAFLLQSNIDQVLMYLNSNSFDEFEFHQCSVSILSQLSLQELLELDSITIHRDKIQNLLNQLVRFNHHGMASSWFEQRTLDARIALNNTHFIFYLLRIKNDILDYVVNNTNLQKLVDTYKEIIDGSIINRLTVLRKELNDNVDLKNAFGLFLIYPKQEAINAFSAFITKYLNCNDPSEYAMDLLEQLESSFRKIGMGFIPHITTDNYRNVSLFNNFHSNFVVYKEVEAIINNRDFLAQKYPLSDLDSRFLLDFDREFSDPELVKSVIRNFFTKYFYTNDRVSAERYANVFIANVSILPITFEKHLLNYVRSTILKRIANKEILYRFVSLFYEFQATDSSENKKGKFIEILSAYIPSDILTKSSINNYIRRENVGKSLNDARIDVQKLFIQKTDSQ